MKQRLISVPVALFRSTPFAVLAISALLLAAGCAPRAVGGATNPASNSAPTGAAPGDPVKVVAPDGSTKSLSLKEMAALPQGRI